MPANSRKIRLRSSGSRSRRLGRTNNSSSGYNSHSPRLSSKIPRTGLSGQNPKHKRAGRNRSGARRKGRAVEGAKNQLKRFTQASILAVALTGFLLLLFTPGEAGYSQEEPLQEVVEDTSTAEAAEEVLPDSVVVVEESAAEELAAEEDITKAAKDEAVFTFHKLWDSLYTNLPKILVAIGILVLTWLLVKLIRFILKKLITRWHSASAVITLTSLSLWLLAIGIAISVVAGDIRALVGSLGLIGLALSWSLQTPIESFTGWLLNSFRSYYRVGDRISVGEVFGDVYKIDFLTTTVWEIGAPYRPGFVQAEQPTGRLVTFPNNEILAGTVVNLTGDFPYVWDELSVAVANESDFREAMAALERIAAELLGDYMKEPAQRYRQTLKKAGLDYEVADKPQVFLNISESWTDIIIRYLVGARERRKWKSELSLRIIEELSKKEFSGKIKAVYPRQQVQVIDPDGLPVEAERLQAKPPPKEK